MRRVGPFLAIAFLFVLSRMFYETSSPGVGTLRFDRPVERVVAAVSGANLDVTTMDRGMPILDEKLLREDLWRSIWYLHSQPPLFNLFVAGMLRLPGSLSWNFQMVNWILALSTFLITFDLMRRLGAGTFIALLVTSLFLLNPNAMWMESAIYYGVVITFLVTLSAWCLERALSHGSRLWLVVFGCAIVALPLLRAFFTLPWVIVVGMIVLLAHRRDALRIPRSVVVAVALVPVIVLFSFQLKQYLLFGQFAGSSWLGCNLATMTASMNPDKQEAVAAGEISQLALVYRNDPPETYLRYFSVPPSGIPALDLTRKESGEPNFNHFVYLPACRQYLSDTTWLILHHPIKYALNVTNSIYIYTGYQIGLYFDHPRQFFERWSLVEVAAPLIGFPLFVVAVGFAAVSLRKNVPGHSEHFWIIAFMLFNVIYVFLVSVLIEKSEGPLYRYQTDPFLFTFLALAATRLLRRSQSQQSEPHHE